MKKFFTPALVLFSSILFTVLFYKQRVGINLLFFDVVILIIIIFVQKTLLRSRLVHFIVSGIVLSTAAVVINYTAIAILVNLFSLFIFSGVLIYPHAKSLMTSLELSFCNLVLSFEKQFQELGEMKAAGVTFKSLFHLVKILILPSVIVLVFLVIYNVSSPYFNEVYNDVLSRLTRFLNQLDFKLVITFVLGIICSTFLLIRVPVSSVINKDEEASLVLSRRNKKKGLIVKPFLFKREVTSCMFLLIVLNSLILVVNVLDIYNVWFHFTWSGSYLKQFVHEGTYLLILSILISIGIVLYFFRGNINFYGKSDLLKKLAVAWMVQNAVLAISVGVRNFWYIQHFALAYKRIGVIFFLLLTLYGIYTVIVKIRKRHSSFYLFAKNGMALYSVLLLMSLFNWDAIIARYNFSHFNTSFIHYDFLSELPDKTLPYLDKMKEELAAIDSAQEKLFRFNIPYMTSASYYNKVAFRKKGFQRHWESKGFLSWNYAEHNAYHKLK